MRRFIARALNKLPKLDKEQIRNLIADLAKENELLEVVLDSMTDGVAVLDTEHRLIFMNKSAERMLPFTAVDPYEKQLWKTMGDEEIGAFLEESILQNLDVHEREFTYGSGGGSRIFSYSIMPLLKKKVIQGKILHIEDVTVKRQEEARLHRAESLASLTTLAAGVAHEIKNPLASMGIHIQIMQRELEMAQTPDKETMNSYLSIVNEEIERLNGIVVDFLFAVRPMDIQLRSTNLNLLVEELINFIHYEMEENNISIQVSLSESPLVLMLDEKYIKQAILNLIKNAEAAMEAGGVLTFITWEEGGSVYFSIRDTGTGISPENLAKIFEPYFTTKDFGSGLGLTLVYKIIKEHGGEISIKSREGEGTTFTFRFPVLRSDQRLLNECCNDENIVFIEEVDQE